MWIGWRLTGMVYIGCVGILCLTLKFYGLCMCFCCWCYFLLAASSIFHSYRMMIISDLSAANVAISKFINYGFFDVTANVRIRQNVCFSINKWQNKVMINCRCIQFLLILLLLLLLIRYLLLNLVFTHHFRFSYRLYDLWRVSIKQKKTCHL